MTGETKETGRAKEDGQGKSYLWKTLKPKKINFRHYFGGAALVLIISQAITGLYMIFYYEPALTDTYKTVQYFNNKTLLGSLTRNIHRYGAFLLVIAALVHLFRGYFRRDYQGKRKLNWVTGVLLFMVLIAFTISGSILPWEWKGYWMMEMFNNWLKDFPVVGDSLYKFFMTTYTPTRNFVVHDIVLPLVTFTLLTWHCLERLKKRGLKTYLARHTIAVLPLLITVIVLAVMFPVPTEDPTVLPFPMEGQYIPAPEWFFVTFLMPYWYFPPREWTFYLFWIPFICYAILFALPFINKKKPKSERKKWVGIAYAGTGVVVASLFTVGLLWGSVKSPWMGCNSCHNTSMGVRMGIPPVTYKDMERNPLLLDRRWMMRHWYQPQVVW